MDAELSKELDEVMRFLSRLSQKVHRLEDKHPAYYALNRAWREVDKARDLLEGRPARQ